MNDVIYNASDFPATFKLVIPPNTGMNIDDLLALISKQGGYVYTTKSGIIDSDRILDRESIGKNLTLESQ